MTLLDDIATETDTVAEIGTGDVLEIPLDGDAVSALVLLATDEFVILDTCDGATPFVVTRVELAGVRRFEPVA